MTAGWVLVAGAGMLVLSVWLPAAGARRWAPRPWRAFTASVGAAVGLALTGWFAVATLTALTTG